MQVMEILMQGLAFSLTEDDVKNALAEVLHKAPFPLNPALKFWVRLFEREDGRSKIGILILPSENAGQAFHNIYGSTGLLIKGSKVVFCMIPRHLILDKVASLNVKRLRDAEELGEEKKRRTLRPGPFELESCDFGHFLADGSFSSAFAVDGLAYIACDLEHNVVRFTLCVEGDSSDEESDSFEEESDVSDEGYVNSFVDDVIQPKLPHITASYPLRAVEAIVDCDVTQNSILFIRANASPCFTLESMPSRRGWRPDAQRVQGIDPNSPMPPGSFSLACTFFDQDDKAAFVDAIRHAFRIPYIPVKEPVRVKKDTWMNDIRVTSLSYLRRLPFGLAFEVDKAVKKWTLPLSEAWSMQAQLAHLCNTHGHAAAPIFRQFVLLSEEENTQKSSPTGHRRQEKYRRSNGTPTTLENRLPRAVELYLEDQQRPKGRLALALPSPAVSYTYHLIVTPTRYILEGPTADSSNSILRRFGHHECFLRVSFEDEDGSKLRWNMGTSVSDLLWDRYRPILLEGCFVAGRHYAMLGYSMSGLKEHSLWFVTPFRDDQGRYWDAETIRESLGDFSNLMYEPARLGARWSQAFSATDPSITLKPEEIRIIADIISPANKVMTDGCSPISTELANAIWQAYQRTKKRPTKGRAPSAFQFRLGGAKGMVVQDPRLRGRVVYLRRSQIKFDAPDNRTFDIQSTSLKPKAMFLNRPLIMLMEHLGSSEERILKLQECSINEAQSVQRSFIDASKVLRHHGMGTSFRLSSLFRNMYEILKVKMGDGTNGSLYNDLTANVLHCAETHILRELKYRARIAVPGSFTLVGVSDEWNCLAEGEIYATVDDEKHGIYKEITGTVAITRSPQIHPGDIQVVTAVKKDELKHLTNVVVFSCRGNRPLSSYLGGGDLDGDDFNLILDPELIPEGNEAPGAYVSLPNKVIPRKCGIEDVVDFIFDYIEADRVGQIAISHLRFADLSEEYGPCCDECIELAELASQAVDFQKSGTPVGFRDLPKHEDKKRPDFLAYEGADLSDTYQSEKLLGQLFRRVPLKKWMPGEWKKSHAPSGGRVIEDALKQAGLDQLGLSLAAPSAELQKEMACLLDDYCQQLLAIASIHTISKHKNIRVSEAELVSGTIMANWSSHHRRREAVGSMNLQMNQLVRAVRMEMRASNASGRDEQQTEDENSDEKEWDDEDDQLDLFRGARQIEEMFKRAWAAWCAAENALKEGPASYGPQSFGLIALGRMLELIKAATSTRDQAQV